MTRPLAPDEACPADEANPATMPARALMCAIRACSNSVHPSDRWFAKQCADELQRRAAVEQHDHRRAA